MRKYAILLFLAGNMTVNLGDPQNDQVMALYMLVETAHKIFINDEGEFEPPAVFLHRLDVAPYCKEPHHQIARNFYARASQDWVFLRYQQFDDATIYRLYGAVMRTLRAATPKARADCRRKILYPTMPS